jgi:hypothetical protein
MKYEIQKNCGLFDCRLSTKTLYLKIGQINNIEFILYLLFLST